MVRHKTAYELCQSQVTTPPAVVSLLWSLIHKRRSRLGSVLDMGAGDCRFAVGGNFDRYVGIEVDRNRAKEANLPSNARIVYNCAFRHRRIDYDAVIGNPPYVRHHDIESSWKEETTKSLEQSLGITLNKHCNLYLYFLSLGLIKTKQDGLVALLIPYEWVSRPSARTIREYIKKQLWDVEVYRFRMPIFEGVLTTASVSIIDKGGRSGNWTFHEVSPSYQITKCSGVVGSNEGVLEYAARGKVWAMRGLSPGTQKVFTLTEEERVRHGLSREDVVPCITSLRNVPRAVCGLTRKAFRKHFVESGKRCWLIKSHQGSRSKALNAYLNSIPKAKRATYTCLLREKWFKYTPHPVPKLLVGSGFTGMGPKVLINTIGAHVVGAIYGIHTEQRISSLSLRRYLLGLNLENRVVAHAHTLRKVEVKQLNAVLIAYLVGIHSHG